MVRTLSVHLLLAGIICSAVCAVHANLANPPIGHTGAPGEGNCGDAGCHAGATNRSGGIDLSVGVWGTDTVPFVVTVGYGENPPIEVFGFQLTVSDSLLRPYREIRLLDSVRTQVETDSTGRQYLSHTQWGTGRMSPCNCTSWNFAWLRPNGSNRGDRLRFYLSAVLADGDGSPAGDFVVTQDRVRLVGCKAGPLMGPPGDVNSSGTVSAADVIAMIGTAFKGGARITPCLGAADLNCSGTFTAADIILLINYLFKSGPPPCDVCPLILDGTWVCG